MKCPGARLPTKIHSPVRRPSGLAVIWNWLTASPEGDGDGTALGLASAVGSAVAALPDAAGPETLGVTTPALGGVAEQAVVHSSIATSTRITTNHRRSMRPRLGGGRLSAG